MRTNKKLDMELIYLWVEDYKNIKKQGFNFSPRLTCKYNEESNNLTIENNEDYIEDFFGDNINITAIVGKNGSGKSSIYKIIIFLFAYYKNKEVILENLTSAFFVFNHQGENKYISYKDLVIKGNVSQYEKKKLDFYTAHFNYMLDTLKDGDSENFFDDYYHKSDKYETPLLLEPYKKDAKIDIENLNYLTKYRFSKIFTTHQHNKFIENFFKPDKIKFISNKKKTARYLLQQEIFRCVHSVESTRKEELESSIVSLKNYIQCFETMPEAKKHLSLLKNKLEKLSTDEAAKNTNSNDSFEEINHRYVAIKIKNKKQLYKDIFSECSLPNECFIEKIRATLNQNNDSESFLEEILKNKKKTPEFEYLKVKNASLFYYEILKTDKNKLKFKKYLDRKVDIKEVEDILGFLPPWVDIEYYQDDIAYSSLSSGEKAFFAFIMGLIFHIGNLDEIYKKDKRYTTVNLFLDETELGFHPEWQKEYIENILLALKEFKIKINIVFATHSPFLLSDLPRQNIIYLDKERNGDCRVINGLKEKKQTFGANIHTLLSDSFFMENGLMGKFAKSKINKIIRFLNGKNRFIDFPVEMIEKVINSIGEPFLKEKLLKMYDDKYPKTDLEKIAELEKQIESIKNGQN